MKVLIVDDDNVDRMSVSRSLTRHHNDTVLFEAVSTGQAEDVLEQEHVDVILLDYRLGAENGLDWFRSKYATRLPETAVVVISSAEDDDLAARCLEAGAQDYLPKNEITPGRLFRALTQARIRYELESELRRSRDELRGLAEKDSLTQLANRLFFEEYLRNAIRRAERGDEHLAIILFDLDHFKPINDRHGHDVGDGVLREVAYRVKRTARDSDLVARLGGDEFAILPHDIDHLASASRLAERVRHALEAPIRFAGLKLSAEASFGIATYPDSGESAEELYKSADIAMYRAKQDGRNRLCFYSSELQKSMLARLQLEEDLALARKKGQFRLFFQPQVTADTQKVTALEALLRWEHPTEGLKTPDQFLSVVEETGQMIPLGAWILQDACRAAAEFNRASESPILMAVNISATQLGDDKLVEHVTDALSTHDLPGELLELELTETALIERPQQARRLFDELVGAGVRIVLDDFGTGYSSLTHINEFPIDTLKVDKAFLWSAMNLDKSRRLLTAVVALAKAMELTVVVEGVETREQYELCLALEVDRMQGYFLSRPAPLGDLQLE